MNQRILDFFAYSIIFVFSCGFFFWYIHTPSTNEEKLQIPPEQASFMIECVYGWDQTPENCKKVLEGEDPPAIPKPAYHEGC